MTLTLSGDAYLDKIGNIFLLTPTLEQMSNLNLKYGGNIITFECESAKLEAEIFLLSYTDKVIISDIDGTITKSDVRGHIATFFGVEWAHKDVTKLYQELSRRGYKIIYLSTRGIGMAGMSKSYVRDMTECNYY
jgi:phosphatidate phosphatase LPIN